MFENICMAIEKAIMSVALLAMIEKFKVSQDNNGFAGCVLMDLSKAFNTINHLLLIAQFYLFSKDACKLIYNYSSKQWHRAKINVSFGTWAELLSGVPQGSVLGPPYSIDLFYEFIKCL